MTDLKGVEPATVAGLAALAGCVVKAKKSEDGGAVVLPAHGRYRAESGRTDDVDWLRFVRA